MEHQVVRFALGRFDRCEKEGPCTEKENKG